MDDAVNYGGIGAVIGHELTHGFDDEGRQFDAKGNLRDWWTPATPRRSISARRASSNEYGGFTVVADVQVNGKLTLGENTADNGGVRLRIHGADGHLGGKEPPPKIDGFTRRPALFPRLRADVVREAAAGSFRACACRPIRTRPGNFRVNGVVSEHAGVSEGVRLQGGPADGERITRAASGNAHILRT